MRSSVTPAPARWPAGCEFCVVRADRKEGEHCRGQTWLLLQKVAVGVLGRCTPTAPRLWRVSAAASSWDSGWLGALSGTNQDSWTTLCHSKTDRGQENKLHCVL